MRGYGKQLIGLLTIAVFVLVTGLAGCAARIYDSEYHDYHSWNRSENTYYIQWETETHRRHEEFRRRDQNEQDEYWQWRHHHDDGGEH